MSLAIFIAVGAPFGFPDAKQSRYKGLFLEFISGSGLSATPAKTVFKRSTKKPADFFEVRQFYLLNHLIAEEVRIALRPIERLLPFIGAEYSR